MLDKFCQEQEMEHDPTADRNREPSEPDANMNMDEDVAAQPEQEDNEEMGEDDAFEDDEFGPQEFSALNNQLDQLQSALDSLESRNDDIHSKLLELLTSSREIRQVMIEENSQEEGRGEGEANNAPSGEDERKAPAAAGGSSNSVVAQHQHDIDKAGNQNECMETGNIPTRKSE